MDFTTMPISCSTLLLDTTIVHEWSYFDPSIRDCPNLVRQWGNGKVKKPAIAEGT
jgi:hypothetical protein